MRVVVRLRPSKELIVDCDPHVGDKISMPQAEHAGGDYKFDAVLGNEATQREAFMTCGLPMLEAALDGQRACLFAYGQTGSGKTFSLLGAEGGKNPHKLDGIVPQIVSELFRRFAAMESLGASSRPRPTPRPNAAPLPHRPRGCLRPPPGTAGLWLWLTRGGATRRSQGSSTTCTRASSRCTTSTSAT